MQVYIEPYMPSRRTKLLQENGNIIYQKLIQLSVRFSQFSKLNVHDDTLAWAVQKLTRME